VNTDAGYTEEEEWSDEFDDDAEEATPGLMTAVTKDVFTIQNCS